jgi:hypothetical protein
MAILVLFLDDALCLACSFSSLVDAPKANGQLGLK